MTDRVYIDDESRELMRLIEGVTRDAEFSMACTALEAVLARRIKREQGDNPNPALSAIAGQIVWRHVVALLDCEGLTDG